MGWKCGCVCDEGCSQVCGRGQHGFMLGASAVVQEDGRGGCTVLGHWAMLRGHSAYFNTAVTKQDFMKILGVSS